MAEATQETATQPVAPVPGESFAQSMERLGGFGPEAESPVEESVEPEAAVTVAEAAKEPKGGAAKAADKPAKGKSKEAAPAENAAELEQFRALAAKLGVTIEDDKVFHKERAAFRTHQREEADKARRWRQQQDLEIQQARELFARERDEAMKQLAGERALREAHERGDYEGVAKALGHESWDKLQEHYMKRIADPNYERLLKLEREAEERKRDDTRRAEENRRAQLAQQRQEARQRYRVALADEMRKSANAQLQVLADDPIAINTIFQIQEEHWDESTQSTVTPEQALNLSIRGARRPLIEDIKEQAARLRKLFPDAPAELVNAAAKEVVAAAKEEKPMAAKKENRPAPKTAVAPTTRAEPSMPARFQGKEAIRKNDQSFSARLREAIAEDNLGRE